MTTALTKYRHHARVERDFDRYYGPKQASQKPIPQYMVDSWYSLFSTGVKQLSPAGFRKVRQVNVARWFIKARRANRRGK